MSGVKIPSTKRFYRHQWKTPNTYDSHMFQSLPNAGGIYALARMKTFGQYVTSKVLYIGMSRNIALRISGHEALRVARAMCLPDQWIQVYFFISEDNLQELERQFIKGYRPLLNTQHKSLIRT